MSESADRSSSTAVLEASLGVSPARALEILNELRDRLGEGAESSYAQCLKQVKYDLVRLAHRASEPGREELYSAGYDLLTHSGMGLLRRFRDIFANDCDHVIARLNGSDLDAWDGAGELSLVDSNEFERDLAVGRLSAKATYNCSQQLTALDRRVAALLNIRRMDTDSNPFAIKLVFTAFVKAAEVDLAGEQLSLILLETFEHYTADELPRVYRGLNEYLVEEGVLKELPIEIEGCEDVLERVPDLGGQDHGVEGIFGRLANGLAGGNGGGLAGDRRPDGLPPLPGWEGSGGTMASYPGADRSPTAPMAFGQLLEGLTGVQRGSGQAAADLGIDIGEFDPTTSVMLRRLAASPLLRWLQPENATTIELIARLFDCIFSDADVPEALHAELGRLQVPILKVALMNKGFFSEQRHPARRLMDVIATAAKGWRKEDEAELLDAIHKAISNVLEGFEKDTDVFSAQIQSLETILQAADHRAQEHVSSLVRRLEQRDRKAVAETVVKDQIARRLAGQTLPEVVQEFVDGVWHELLIRVYVKQGGKSEVWQRVLGILDDLIWSVQPKTTPEARKRLLAMLPVLLRRLPEGMALIGKRDAWDLFLQPLMKLHMQAIKPKPDTDARNRYAERAEDGRADTSVQASQPEPVAATGAESTRTVQMSESASPDGQRDIDRADQAVSMAAPSQPESKGQTDRENQTVHTETEQSVRTADPFDEIARRIEVGDWVFFGKGDDANGALRASWMSKLNGILLFTDRRGRNAEILSVEQIAELLRKDVARVLSRDPMIDRAVARLLQNAAPGEAAIS
ncbi:MAG: DUF1631 family protein [Thiohalocapsa sp.]